MCLYVYVCVGVSVHVCFVIIHMRGRTVVKRYKIGTPFRQVVKSTRYRKPHYTARMLLKASHMRIATLKEVTSVVRHECDRLCRIKRVPSYLYSAPVDCLKDFDWHKILNELHEKAPVFYSILKSSAKHEDDQARQWLLRFF